MVAASIQKFMLNKMLMRSKTVMVLKVHAANTKGSRDPSLTCSLLLNPTQSCHKILLPNKHFLDCFNKTNSTCLDDFVVRLYSCSRSDKVSKKKNQVTHQQLPKCIPRSIKASFCKHPRNESLKSPISGGPRRSSGLLDSSDSSSLSVSNPTSKRFTEPSLRKTPSK